MVLPIFVGCFIGRAHDGRGVHNAYMVVVRLLGCAVLFCFANVLSALLAKIMATHFHKDAHFSKMNDALQKVRIARFQCLPLLRAHGHRLQDLPCQDSAASATCRQGSCLHKLQAISWCLLL